MQTPIQKLAHQFTTIVEAFPDFAYAGDPILRTPTKEVSLEEGILIGEKLGTVLREYRRIAGFGRGLAAPQLGIEKSVFVTFVDETVQIFLNPKIIDHANECNYYRELCLSCGMMAADVKRPIWITMEWTDIYGKPQRETFDGFLARLYQHEEAHLRGILALDQAEPGSIEHVLFDPLKERLRESRED